MIWLPLVLLLLITSGCAKPHYGLVTCQASPRAEETVTSLRYRVRTDAGKEAAQEVDRFMERAAALWTPLLGVPDPLSLPLEVRLYRNSSSLAELASSRHLPSEATGLYLPSPQSAIHVACLGIELGHPYRTLLHEGTHQFIHLGAGYREPHRPPATPPLLALPLWLNEGLASYFEAAYVTPDLLQPGRPDPARLAELQAALRDKKVPSLEVTLSKRYGESFTTVDYAVAWGVVYALMQAAPPPWATGGREWLNQVVEQARHGWTTATGLPIIQHDDPSWWKTVTDCTYKSFGSFTTSRNLSVAAWEMQWRNWILAHP